jgi:hypothetical protein
VGAIVADEEGCPSSTADWLAGKISGEEGAHPASNSVAASAIHVK